MPALGLFLGSATGLSAAVITKVTERWKAEQRAFAERDLMDYAYPGGWTASTSISASRGRSCACW